MKFTVLASGSKGNSSYIESLESKILIDIGTRSIYIEKNLNELGVNPSSLDGILITHTHVDHVQGLRVFIKKYNTKVYLTRSMYNELSHDFSIDNYEIIDDNFKINDLMIYVLKTSHDADDSNGYIIECGDSKIAYITDTGYIHKKYHNQLENMDAYIMESNHDIELLMNGRYPYHLKQRILGSRGHLSNDDASDYLSKFSGDNTKNIVLIHLSEENNREEIAFNTLDRCLNENSKNGIDIIISKQNERTDVIEV